MADDRIRRATRGPEGPGVDVGEGGMTGATGELTPESSREPFVPAERREAASADHQADVTAAIPREGDPDDMERHPSASEAEEAAAGDKPRLPDGEARLGGDVRREPKDERF